MPKQHDDSVDDRVRRRIRQRRLELGWSLDELSYHVAINASTLSRIETGDRRLALDTLAPIADTLGLSLDEIVRPPHPDDIVIRPAPTRIDGMTVWPLDPHHRTGLPSVMKLRFGAERTTPDPRSHPGHEWIYVLDGILHLYLDGHDHYLDAGKTVAFPTTAPHWHGAHNGPVDLLVIFDEHAQRTHLQP